MDPYLPYHLGGWVDFSQTNFSCLVEYMTDPWTYSTGSRFEGSIPQIRRWIAYQFDAKAKGSNILSAKTKIFYRGDYFNNPMRTTEVMQGDSRLQNYLLGYCGLDSQADHERSLDDIVNCRGLHNAKPKIRLGLDNKWYKNRQRIYREFKRYPKEMLNLFSKDTLGVNQALFAVRNVADAPSYLSYPRFLMKEGLGVQDGKGHKIVVYKRGVNYSRNISEMRGSIMSTIESLVSGDRWYARSDPFVFYDFWKRRKTGYLLSDVEIPSILGTTGTLPRDFRAFCPNSTLFAKEFAVRTGFLATEWRDNTSVNSEFQMHLYKDTFETVLPIDLVGRWRKIKALWSRDFYLLRNIIGQVNLTNRREFLAALEAMEELYEEVQPRVVDDSKVIDEDISYVIERFEDMSIYTRLIKEVYDVNDLLEDEGLLYESEIDLDEDDDDYYPQEDFEFFEEGDIESEDDNIDLNEIRRLARSDLHPSNDNVLL